MTVLTLRDKSFAYIAWNILERGDILVLGGGANYTYTYDENERIKTATSGEGVKSEYTYDEYGNTLVVGIQGETATDPKIESSQVYSSDGNYVTESIGDTRKTTENRWDTELGELLGVTNPLGSEQVNEYDTMGRLTRTERDYTYTYDERANTRVARSQREEVVYTKSGLASCKLRRALKWLIYRRILKRNCVILFWNGMKVIFMPFHFLFAQMKVMSIMGT